MRGVTALLSLKLWQLPISTHTPHARRDILRIIFPVGVMISTHTPHARRDNGWSGSGKTPDISTHTPHARRDGRFADIVAPAEKFLLTRLMRGVTTAYGRAASEDIISTHTPHARRDIAISHVDDKYSDFYSHASCEA